MSQFSRNIRDYIRFDEYDIEERFGSEALDAVMSEAQKQLDELLDAYDYSQSPSEREFAEERISDFQFGEFDAENIASDYEFAFLQNYMSQSYKSDYSLIERYVELVGYGSSAPPPRQPKKQEEEEEEEDDDENETVGD